VDLMIYLFVVELYFQIKNISYMNGMYDVSREVSSLF
jgi:hypothetical protein